MPDQPLKLGERDAALRQYERSLALRPRGAVYGELGRQHERNGDWRAAYDAFERGMALDPQSPALWRGAAQSALELGRPARARNLLARAAALEPDNEATRQLQARAQGMLAERRSAAQ